MMQPTGNPRQSQGLGSEQATNSSFHRRGSRSSRDTVRAAGRVIGRKASWGLAPLPTLGLPLLLGEPRFL